MPLKVNPVVILFTVFKIETHSSIKWCNILFIVMIYVSLMLIYPMFTLKLYNLCFMRQYISYFSQIDISYIRAENSINSRECHYYSPKMIPSLPVPLSLAICFSKSSKSIFQLLVQMTIQSCCSIYFSLP